MKISNRNLRKVFSSVTTLEVGNRSSILALFDQSTIKSVRRRKYSDCRLVLLLLFLLLSVEQLLDTTGTLRRQNCRREIGFCNIWRICGPTYTQTSRDGDLQRNFGCKFCKSISSPVSSTLQSRNNLNGEVVINPKY